MTAEERADRTADADALCAKAWQDVSGPETGLALVAVGGYGRAELAPYSDLDVVLVSDLDGTSGDDQLLRRVAEQVWYPLWDSGANVDHSVRTLPEMLTAAEADLRVALGLLDVRHLAGDPNLTLRLRATMLAHWRRERPRPAARAAEDGAVAARADGRAGPRVGARPQGGRGRGP